MRGDAEPGGAVRERGPGHVGRTVAEPVGLDHGHQLAGRLLREQRDVGGHRVEVDVEARAGVLPAGEGEHGHAATSARSSTGPYSAAAAPVLSAQ